MLRYFLAAGLAVGLFASFACSDSNTPNNSSSGGPSGSSGSSGSNPNCGKPGRTGQTESTQCGKCSAGQYCSTSGNYKCVPGCTSDDNCGENERCVRCDTNTVGTCQSCSRSDEDVCKTAKEECARDTPSDQRCISPGKAFVCPSNLEPTGQGTCAQADPGVWCCGGGVVNFNCRRATENDMTVCQGGKAYDCPHGEEVTGCKLMLDGHTYCCK